MGVYFGFLVFEGRGGDLCALAWAARVVEWKSISKLFHLPFLVQDQLLQRKGEYQVFFTRSAIRDSGGEVQKLKTRWLAYLTRAYTREVVFLLRCTVFSADYCWGKEQNTPGG